MVRKQNARKKKLTDEDVRSACEILEMPEIAGFLAAAGTDYVSSDTLVSDSGPDSVARGLRHRLLAAVQGPLSDSLLPIQPGLSLWSFPTAEVRSRLHRFDLECTPHSPLAAWLEENPSLVVQLRIENAIQPVRSDGYEIDEEGAKELVLLGHEPRTKPERVVANAFSLVAQRDDYSRPFSVDLFLEIFSRLTEGLAVPSGWLEAPIPEDVPEAGYPFPSNRATLEWVCAMANQADQGSAAHPLLVDVLLEQTLMLYRPFPVLNATMGRLLWRYHTTHIGYPVLGLAPYVSTVHEGRVERGKHPVTPMGPSADRPWRPDPNITGAVSVGLADADQALSTLRTRVQARVAQDAVLESLVKAHPALNPRQRRVIGRAIRMPSATFRIPYHQTAEDIAYSTARMDLVTLEEAGYLVRQRKGHAFVYTAAPTLLRKVGPKTAQAVRAAAAAGIWD